MGITLKLDTASLQNYLNGKLTLLDRSIQENLIRYGEQAVSDARANGSYTDRTGNLRSSIGYVVFKDGVQQNDNFQETSGGTKGVIISQEKAVEIAVGFPLGYALVVVAGMQYAAAVESKGYEVLSVSALKAKMDLTNAIQKLAVR